MYLIFKMYLSFNKYYIYQLPNFKAGNTKNFSLWGICTLEMFYCARSTNDPSQKINSSYVMTHPQNDPLPQHIGQKMDN